MRLRRSKISMAAVLLFCCAWFSSSALAENPGYQIVRLTSGKQIKLLGISPGAAAGGQAKALTLRYQTDKNMSDKKEIAAEADDVWDMFKVEVEKNNLSGAVITVLSQPLGAGKFNQQYDFVLIKDGTGRWQCFNDDVVGVGTPAKVAYRQGLNLMKQGNVNGALAMFDKCI